MKHIANRLNAFLCKNFTKATSDPEIWVVMLFEQIVSAFYSSKNGAVNSKTHTWWQEHPEARVVKLKLVEDQLGYKEITENENRRTDTCGV